MYNGDVYKEGITIAFNDIESIVEDIGDDHRLLDDDLDGDPSDVLLMLETIKDNAKKAMEACETLYDNLDDAVYELQHQLELDEEREEARLEKLYSNY